MPEGDTIFRTARTLRAVLEGRRLSAASAHPRLRGLRLERLEGQHVERVESRGKHLLLWFSPSGLALHTHMMMSGSWHTYPRGAGWRKPRRLATAVLETAEAVAVCFSAPVCELLSPEQVLRHPQLAALGPDPLAPLAGGPEADLAEARRRLDAFAGEAIGVALGDQRVLAGVGNVYRCEVLFIRRVDPWTVVAEVAPEERDALLAEAARLLARNVAEAGPRRTTTTESPGRQERLHVYGRARRPCRRCSTPVRVARQGPQARLTYWCPRCQGPGPRQVP